MRILRLIPVLLILGIFMPQLALSENRPSWYTDVPNEHTNRKAIFYLTDQGIASGFEDNTFRAEEAVTRAQAAKFILNTAEVEVEDILMEQSFTDLDYDAWYIPYIHSAVAMGVINSEAEELRPNQTVKLAEAVKMLITATETEVPEGEFEFWYQPYMNYARKNGLFSISSDPGYELTRGGLAELIYRFKKGGFVGEAEYGVASYYGWSFDGANTASGKKLEAYGYQAAHQTLPFGTMVKVTSTDNNKSVFVEVVDRGPYVTGRVIDLTPAAFEELAPLSAGLAHVYLEVLK